jgi:hypothetical protein
LLAVEAGVLGGVDAPGHLVGHEHCVVQDEPEGDPLDLRRSQGEAVVRLGGDVARMNRLTWGVSGFRNMP